jgi:predicted aspartyl protease
MPSLARILAAVLVASVALLAVVQPSLATAQTVSRADVPLESLGGRTAIRVTVGAGGEPLLALFDTGAQGITIRRSVAERLGLQVVGEALMGSPMGGQPVAVKVVGLPGLSVGGLAAKPAPRSLDALLVDDARMLVATDLVIGPNQFPQTLIELDLAQQRLRLQDAPAAAPQDWLPTNARGLLETELQVGGHTAVAHVDTGKAGWLMLPRRMAEGLSLRTALKPVGKARTVDREMTVEGAEYQGPVKLAGLDLHYAAELRFADVPFAVVGTEALRQSVIRIDTAHRRWQLQPPSSRTMAAG